MIWSIVHDITRYEFYYQSKPVYLSLVTFLGHDNKKMSNRNLDEDDEFKGERIYETKVSRLRAIAHIIKKYLQIKGIESNPKTVDDAMAPIINMVLNDLAFRKFTLDNYKAFIFYDEKDTEFSIKRITNEMLELIKEEENIDNLDSKELENKINRLESGLNKKDGVYFNTGSVEWYRNFNTIRFTIIITEFFIFFYINNNTRFRYFSMPKILEDEVVRYDKFK